MLLTEIWASNSETTLSFTRVGQNKYIVDNKDQVSHAQERSYEQERRKNNDSLVAVSALIAETSGSKSFSIKRNQRISLKKCLILRQRQGKYKMSLEHLIIIKSKEVLKKNRWMWKGHRSQPEMAKSQTI